MNHYQDRYQLNQHQAKRALAGFASQIQNIACKRDVLNKLNWPDRVLSFDLLVCANAEVKPPGGVEQTFCATMRAAHAQKFAERSPVGLNALLYAPLFLTLNLFFGFMWHRTSKALKPDLYDAKH